MKVALKILPRPEVLDTQGRALRDTLKTHDFNLKDCHVGKYIVLELETEDLETAKKMVQAMADKGLYNPLIENYQLEVIKEKTEQNDCV